MSQRPEPPYYAVIFISRRSDEQQHYNETAARMMQLAARQDGFLGVESVREDKTGITVSWWKDEQSINNWKQQIEHQQAQRQGREYWYSEYSVQVARVERAYEFKKK